MRVQQMQMVLIPLTANFAQTEIFVYINCTVDLWWLRADDIKVTQNYKK